MARVQRPYFPSAEEGHGIRVAAAGLVKRSEDAKGAGWIANIPKYLESLHWVER